MGGCSSKPKTAEFEGGINLQEDVPQGEAPRKNLEAENADMKGSDRQQESSKRSMQNSRAEREQDGLHDNFEASEKQMIAGFSSDEERQVLEDDHHIEKQIQEEAIHRAEKDLEEIQISPEVLALESLGVHEDSGLFIKGSKELQETVLPAAIKSESDHTQHKLLTLSKETSENEAKDVFPESNTRSLQDICISMIQDTLKVEVKPIFLKDRQIELSKDVSVGGQEILELQNEPFVWEDVHPGLQGDDASKGRVESEHHYQDGEQRLDDNVDCEVQDKHFGAAKVYEELCKKPEVGACEVIHATSNGVLPQERGGDVLKDLRKPIWEVEIKGLAYEEAAEDFTIGTPIAIKRPFAEASDQNHSRKIDSSNVVYPAMTTDINPNNLQHVMHEQAAVQKEQDVDVDAGTRTSRSAESLTKLAKPDGAPIEYKMSTMVAIPQADIDRVNDVLVKEPSAETLKTTQNNGGLVSEKVSINDNLSFATVVAEESSHLQLLLENSVGKDHKEESYADVVGQWKSDASFTAVTASQVVGATKKPEAQSAQVEIAELAFIPAQDIAVSDIDEVLEKLASEFERQERVAHATS